MDPSLYSDSYKRYKIGTNYIASWLVETAKSCGATLDFLCLETHNQPVEISNGSKQKGKKLKAKHKGKESGSCKVPVGQFVRLATIIAETAQGKGVKVEIPRSVLQIGKEVIALRMRCSSFFSTQALSDELIQEKNGSHMHFIGVFEEVVRILESCPTPSSSAQNKTKEGKYSVKLQGDLVNSFEVLELEETNPSFEEASTEPRTAHSKPTSATGAPLKKPLYEVEAEPSGNELLFSLFCFFQDVNEVRTFIKDTWAQFRDGEIDLASAAITTDITIDLIYQKEKEFLDAITIPKHFKPLYLGIGNILLSVIRQSHKEDPECAALLTDRVDTVVMDMADWLFVSPCSHLEDFKALAAEGPTPVMEGGTPMMDNVRDTWEDGSPVETIPTSIKYEDDKMLLFNRLDDILLLIHTGIEPPALDKVTIGLRALLINEQKVSVGLAFALQTFIDIQDILGQDIEVGFRTLCESGKRATAQLQEYFQYSRNMRKDDSPWPDFANQNLLRVLSVITNWTKKDPLSMTATELTGQFYPDRQLLRNHPLLCGLITFHIDLVMWEGGMQMSNAWQSILNWAHLYNAVKQELGCEEWQDMEFLIGEHNAKHLFFGGLPTKPEEYEKRWSLAMGISAQVSASNRRSKESVFARGRACV